MSEQLNAIGNFIWAMSEKPAWGYRVTLPESNKHSLAGLFGVTVDDLVNLFHKIGWIKKHFGGRHGAKREFLGVKMDAINAFIHQSDFSSIAEMLRITYNNQRNCCFVCLGKFGADGPFAARLVVHDKSLSPPSITQDDISLYKIKAHLQETIRLFVELKKHKSLQSNKLPSKSPAASSGNPVVVPLATTPQKKHPQIYDHQHKAIHEAAAQHGQQKCDSQSPESRESKEHAVLSANEVEDNLVLQMMIQQTLLPTIFTDDFFSTVYWRNPSKFGNVSAAICKISLFLIGRKEKRMTEAMGCSPTLMTPLQPPIILPALTKHGVHIENKWSVQTLIRVCVALSHKHPKHNLLTTVMANARLVTLVEVPCSENVLQIKKRDVTHKWIERILNALGTPERRRKKFSFCLLP